MVSLLDLDDVGMVFRGGGLLRWLRRDGEVRALTGISLSVGRDETLGLVGESGSGKSTLGLIAIGLLKPTSGRVLLEGRPLDELLRARFRETRRRLQIVLQNPYASMTPWLTVGGAIAEALAFHHRASGAGIQRRVGELLEMVGLEARFAKRYPREFSGGQRQRLAIARALALEPELLVCDEVTSALDVSIRSQIVNLLLTLKADRPLAYLFITHDLHVARAIADRVAVMFAGHVVEEGSAAEVFSNPAHPYTQQLIASEPRVSGAVRKLPERRAEAGVSPAGCPFALRCPQRMPVCTTAMPAAVSLADGHLVRCYLYGEETLA
jgi:oligopeptide/dipeptide ABC transporter ATP-binding protein